MKYPFNRILERYGFHRVRTDSFDGISVDYFEKILIEKKDSEAEERSRREVFEQKYLNRITQEYTATLATFPEKVREKKVTLIDAALTDLSQRLRDNPAIDYGEKQHAILKFKLARHFQRDDHINTALLYDAIVETPKFINNDKGSIHRLFDIHQQKQLMLIPSAVKGKPNKPMMTPTTPMRRFSPLLHKSTTWHVCSIYPIWKMILITCVIASATVTPISIK
jgi:hypothetical protein